MTRAAVLERGGLERQGHAPTADAEGELLSARLEELKRIYPPMIVRFPEDCCLARADRWLTLWLASIPWGRFAHVVFLCGHVFNSPWNALCSIPLMIYALEAPGFCSWLAWVVAGLTLLPIFLLLRDKLDKSFFFGGGHLLLGPLGVLAWLWAVDGRAFQTSCLYLASWLYSSQLTFLLKCLAGRRRPALAMREEVEKLPRLAFWAKALEVQREGDNAYHSFPSGDAAAAACFASAAHLGLSEAHHLVLLIAALAFYGRVYIFAHHLLDVLVGAALGAACTFAFHACAGVSEGAACTFAFHACAGVSEGQHALLAWSIFDVSAIYSLFLLGPAKALLLASSVFALCGQFSGRFLCPLAFYSVLTLVGIYQYVRVSRDQKDWVMDHLEEFFACVALQEKALPSHLLERLERKRAEFRERAAEPRSAFPSDVYSLYAYAPGGGAGPKPFAADWRAVASMMAMRLEDFERQTGLELRTVDVVLGIYTGGALLAPLVASRLGCKTCYIRVSRYSDDVLGVRGALRTLFQKLSRRHEKLYRVSEAPDESLLKDKVVLMVDDAVGTGGTFREAHKYCMQAGARDVRGVALDSITPGRHIWDPSLPRPAPQKLCVPCFLPWGLR